MSHALHRGVAVSCRGELRSRPSKRLELLQQRRQQFTDRGMYLYGARYGCVGLPCCHHVEQCMDDLITVKPQNAGAQQALVFGIHQNFHKALGLTGLACAADALHGHLGAQQRAPACQRFFFVHADST